MFVVTPESHHLMDRMKHIAIMLECEVPDSGISKNLVFTAVACLIIIRAIAKSAVQEHIEVTEAVQVLAGRAIPVGTVGKRWGALLLGRAHL